MEDTKMTTIVLKLSRRELSDISGNSWAANIWRKLLMGAPVMTDLMVQPQFTSKMNQKE